MSDRAAHTVIALYDGDCGFCKVILAALLRWDRARRIDAAPIQSADGERLLSNMPVSERLASWHVINGAGAVHSGGFGLPVAFAVLPGGSPLARIAAWFPRSTSRAYDWVASNRAQLGRPFGERSRAWAAGVIAERERTRRAGRFS
jgi:predicted DCC family thiol-disulfide oxidoreductase YuxK